MWCDYLKFNSKDTWTKVLTGFWCLYYKLWTNFTHYSCVSIADFEQINVGQEMFDQSWVISLKIRKKRKINPFLVGGGHTMQVFSRNISDTVMSLSEPFKDAYLEPSQTFKMEFFAKIVYDWKQLTFPQKALSQTFDWVLYTP